MDEYLCVRCGVRSFRTRCHRCGGKTTKKMPKDWYLYVGRQVEDRTKDPDPKVSIDEYKLLGTRRGG